MYTECSFGSYNLLDWALWCTKHPYKKPKYRISVFVCNSQIFANYELIAENSGRCFIRFNKSVSFLETTSLVTFCRQLSRLTILIRRSTGKNVMRCISVMHYDRSISKNSYLVVSCSGVRIQYRKTKNFDQLARFPSLTPAIRAETLNTARTWSPPDK